MKTLIAVPTMDMIHYQFFESFIHLKKGEDASVFLMPNTLIYDARNIISLIAMQKNFDRVMWMDSDMTFPQDTILKLAKHMDDDPECKMVTGLYVRRKIPVTPTIYSTLQEPGRDENDKVIKRVNPYIDYPRDAFFPIKACGFGCVMTSVDLIREVWNTYSDAFTPFSWCGEDLSFCKRVNDLGYTIWCDSSIRCGHVGTMIFTDDMIAKEVNA